MKMHASIQAADRTLLPRGLIARRRTFRVRWKFRLGSVVEFGDDIAIVTDRSLSAMGRQFYDITLLGANHGGRRHRTVLGIALSRAASFNPMAEQASHEDARQASPSVDLVQAPARAVLLL